MKSRIIATLLSACVLSAGAAVSTNSSGHSTNSLVVAPTNPPPLQIVTCHESTDMDALIAEFQLSPKFIYRGFNGFAAPMDAATIQALQSDPRVLAVEADGPVSLCNQTNSTGIVRMGIDQFPVARINGTNEPLDVHVAVIDSGISPHPELNIYQSICPFSSDYTDGNGHGTAVAGVLGAMDNEFGVVGVAPGVQLWNIKVRDATHNNWTYILSGMNQVRLNANLISVANISLANSETGAPIASIRGATRNLVNAGIVVVACAGNNTNDLAGPDGIYGTGDDVYPAALSEAMAVSAMDPATDSLWPQSNFSQIERTNTPNAATVANYVFSPGGAIDVAAPGVGILTTATATHGDYMTVEGTSFAAPHVAGLVALYIAANGRATNAEGVYRIRQAIIDASLPQSQWNTADTEDPDTNPEPLAIVSEAWIPKPVLTNSGSPGDFQLSFATVPGYDYTVQSAANLTPPVAWTNLATVGTGSSSNAHPATVTDTNVADQSVYRLERTPSP